ncbi:dihydropteroate synthase [Gordonia rhizosphera]|uniref:dihydropteroate synthase n=1 Tax=Gordonia rhizosphera TaxID=83341 RepID=UPI001C3F40ED|nr:dihydropteroate synthase [Gordonia rhizosphera]
MPVARLLERLAQPAPMICGIVNVTPDSFSDGGRYRAVADAVEHARVLIADGADMLDIGGESTRPGATPPSPAEELDRVVPVVSALARTLDVPISVDTSRPEVMRAAVAAGASVINDVRALRAPGALATAAELGVPVCLMHMQGTPGTMQVAPTYTDVADEVMAFLIDRVNTCREAGIPTDHLIIDPGFGFGKSLAHNIELLAALPRFADLGLPVMAGLSRKGMLGAITDRAVDQRTVASATAAMIAATNGASILRVHDVAATVDAVAVGQAVLGSHRNR